MSVNMVKGQKISLAKADGGELTSVRMGLGWDAVPRRGMFGKREQEIDLDASVVLFADQQVVDAVYFGQLVSKDGSIRHTGDNLTGAGDGDDESIIVDLQRVPPQVTSLVFVVSSFSGQDFTQVANAAARLVDETNGQELARYALTGGAPVTGMVMARLYRHQGAWKMAAIGETANGRHLGELMPTIVQHA